MKTFLASLCLALLASCSPILAADYTVTAANVVASSDASTAHGTAGASITAGMSLAKDTNGTIKAFDANAAAPINKFVGISLNAASTGQPIFFATADPSFTPGFTVAAGAIVIGSATPGLLCPAADLASGHYLTIVGVGIGSNKIKFSPVAAGVAVP